ncbi:MAG: hypothetical protein ACI97K_002462 [Glaciecola sp.]
MISAQFPSVTIEDLHTIISKFTGSQHCEQLFNDYARQMNIEINMQQATNDEFLSFCEHALGRVVGSSSSKALIESLVRGKVSLLT